MSRQTLSDSGPAETIPSQLMVYGWLYLNRRGQWFLPSGRITHPRLLQYLHHHYRFDPESGAMVVDLGPQKVMVMLEYTPWIYRVVKEGEERGWRRIKLETHTGKLVERISQGYVDEKGNLLIQSEWGIGVISDTDLALLSDRISEGPPPELWLSPEERILLKPIDSRDIPRRFGYRPRPEPDEDRVSLSGEDTKDRNRTREE